MPTQQLLVHLLFHPKSTAARTLAQNIHRELNDDVVVPGLRVPTVFCPVEAGGLPPKSHRLELAQHCFVVPLADDELCVDDDWCRFVGDVWEACAKSENGKHRCVPIQLSSHAWPLDDRLSHVNFGRAFAQPEGDARNQWVTRRVVIELCRFLQELDPLDKSLAPDGKAPTKLFLSHAKADMNVEPRVTQQFINQLGVDQPVAAWVDSGDIETGSKFSDAISDGVKRTSLLVILTDNYSSREWCREEVMLAKEHQRPIVVVDALSTLEIRSFPFLENVPKVRWNGNAQVGIDLILKETLRHLHSKAILESIKQPEDKVFLRAPEPAMLLGVTPGSNILYPDPPLGVGELKRLSKAKVTFSTPLERSAAAGSLDGQLISLSMSESSDAAQWGMDELHQVQTMLELSRHLLIRGATLAYGGHLGDAGYTRRLFELVRSHNSRDGVQAFDRIVNHYGWPLPALSAAQRAELKQVATILRVQRPADVNEHLHPDLLPEIPAFFPGNKSPEHRYAWCRGMTEMRAFQADRARSNVVARIVLGGTFEMNAKGSWYSSRMPGVLEELLLSLKAKQPVYLIGAFGGAAKLAIDLLLGKKHRAASWSVQSQAPFAQETRDLYLARGQSWWYYDDEARVTGLTVDDTRSIVEFLADIWQPDADRGWETHLNPLTSSQNLELFETVDVGRMVELVQMGLNAELSIARS